MFFFGTWHRDNVGIFLSSYEPDKEDNDDPHLYGIIADEKRMGDYECTFSYMIYKYNFDPSYS